MTRQQKKNRKNEGKYEIRSVSDIFGTTSDLSGGSYESNWNTI